MKQWLRNKLHSFLYPDNAAQLKSPTAGLAVRSDDGPDIDGLRFTVMSANGGVIVQLRQYDRKTDRSNHSTHIITDGEDIAERIGQIVSLEMLRS
jgi:hypothetical protein